MDPQENFRGRAEQAFNRYLDALQEEEGIDWATYVQAQPEELRAELERIHEDFQFLRENMGEAPSGLVEDRVLGDYRLIQELGRGGMGTVWEAEQISLRRSVALKLLAPQISLSPQGLQRFRLEAEAGSRLEHPGVVRVYAVGEAEGIHYIAQQLVPGGYSLADYLAEMREGKELPKRYYNELATLFAKIADALHVAHKAGVIHRDVKPGNILLSAQREPHVADFGLAKVQDQLGLSRTSDSAGTPFYMSPEQVASKQIELDHRTDVFSLGSTLYEALTLQRAFEGDTSQQVAEKILLETPPDPRQLRSRVPRDLAVICLKALEKKPDHRYADMAALAADLRHFLADEQIEARPPSALVRCRRWVRRHAVLTSALAIGAVMIFALGYLFFEAQASRIKAQQSGETAESVAEFLMRLFDESASVQAGDSLITAKELFETGERLLGTDLEDQPEVRGSMMEAMGWGLFRVQSFERAENLLRDAMMLREQTLGSDDPASLRAKHRFAVLLASTGRAPDAIKLHREVLAGRVRVLGEDDHDTMEAKLYLARALNLNDEQEEAEKWHIECQEDHLRVFGEEHPETMASWIHLAVFYTSRKQYDKAADLFPRAVRGAELDYGPDHLFTWLTKGNYGDFLVRTKQPELAIEVLVPTVSGLSRSYPPHQRSLRRSRQGLVKAYVMANELEAAKEVLEQQLADFERAYDPDGERMISPLNELVLFHRTHRQFEAARPYAERRLQLLQAWEGEDSPDTLRAQKTLGWILIDLDQLTEAAEIWERCLAGRRTALGNDNRYTLKTMHDLAGLYQTMNDLAKAEALAREAVERTAGEDSRLGERQERLDEIRALMEED